MKSINEILTVVIKHDPALTGFKASDLPEAAKARIANTMQSIEMHCELESEELDLIESWTGGKEIFNKAEFQTSEQGCTYYVYADGSLYFSSTGDSEVWAFASDFATDRIINGYERKIDGMDAALLNHLGTFYAQEIANRE